jgi:hypothetical protein
MGVINSIQSNIKRGKDDMTSYSLFLGGLDVTQKALQQYDPLRTGYARVFFVGKPVFLSKLFEKASDTEKKRYKSFWHMLEYGFVSVDGIQNTSLEFEAISGGYAGRSFEIPTLSRDETNSITLRVYEMAGSPMREMLDLWITGIADPYTGLSHYQGVRKENADIALSQANHTAEMIYVQTDPTGNSNGIEYAALLCNMVPKIVKKDHFNYESGAHPLTQLDIEFTATKYESRQINEVAKALVAKQKILSNYTYFQSGYVTSGTGADNAVNSYTAVPSASWATDAAAKTEYDVPTATPATP